MSRVPNNPAIEVVEIESSDDEEGGSGRSGAQLLRSASSTVLTSPSSYPRSGIFNPSNDAEYLQHKLESRSFWEAGTYEVTSTKYSHLEGELEHARVHPKFLHSNATSHRWAFGAIAELLDNAVDEISSGATFVKVDKVLNPRDNSPVLLFQDDGGGMDPDRIRKCMSLGYSSKNSTTTIGQYGNGFKTSTMRLGADVIVFSRSTRSGHATQSVGLLSYTFLCQTGQDDVIVPMVDFDISNNWAEPIVYSSLDDWTSNLNTIIEWCPFASKEELMAQFDGIGSHGSVILIYNLWLDDEGIYELSFDDDKEDIRLKDETSDGSLLKINKTRLELQSHISYRLRHSLRAYASILYLRKFKNFKIILRGRSVEQFNIADDLKHHQVISYKPQLAVTSEQVSVKVTIGFIKEAPDIGVTGFYVYHKNRLIRPFWKVTADGSSRARCIVGVLEANFINPAHDKQDFERSTLYIRLEARLKQMVMEYWKSHCHLIGQQPPRPSAKMQQQFVTFPANNLQNEVQQCRYLTGVAVPSRNDCSDETQNGWANESRNSSPSQNIPGISSGSCRSVNASGSQQIDQLCEENIQLFLSCEEHVKKENVLKQTISKLEEDLEETKRKCAQLSAHLESRKQLLLLKQQVGKT